MCGIFGLAISEKLSVSPDIIRRYADYLFAYSESRGKEASGIALRDGQKIVVYKQPESACDLKRSAEYRKLFSALSNSTPAVRRSISLIGHSRLVTNGIEVIPGNNQPVLTERYVGVHNGIIVNDVQLWKKYPDMRRRAQVDTEVLLSLLERCEEDDNLSVQSAIGTAFSEIQGTASVAIYPTHSDDLYLATNNGSIHTFDCRDEGWFFFASERYILEQFSARFRRGQRRLQAPGRDTIKQLAPGRALRLRLSDLAMEEFVLSSRPFNDAEVARVNGAPAVRIKAIDLSERDLPENSHLRRCSKCILLETMPFIEFDEHGVCNYCHSYEPIKLLGRSALEERVAQYRTGGGEPECLIAVSGGRDSCYGLHVLCKEFGIKPLAYTYDWGLVTDLGRRNQARLCGKLGIEQILVSANIKKKREYVRSNVEAWLRRPDLGMIPLFMAGDKQYFYHAKKVKDHNRLLLSFLCENRLERARFKSGFCGIREGGRRLFNLNAGEKAKMLGYYARQYLLNPAYFNTSLFDTLGAFYSSYLAKHDEHLQLFDYVAWDEKTVVDTLRVEYDWELATDTKSTWRIGDGTAAFYNYIYYTVAGFTENDALRSNQIREGVLDRQRAIELVREENQPRWESMIWYSTTIGFDLNDALRVINKIPKLYAS